MNNQKLLEAVADIAYYAGYKRYYSGNSRADIFTFIWWAKEFEKLHDHTDWDEKEKDYMISIEEFTAQKINSLHA